MAAVLALSGGGAYVAWPHTPWHHAADTCGGPEVAARLPVVVGMSQPGALYSSGMPRSATEAEDQLVGPTQSKPLETRVVETRIDPAAVARYSAVVATLSRIKLAPGAYNPVQLRAGVTRLWVSCAADRR